MISMNNSQGLMKLKENGSEYNDIKAKNTPVAMVAPEVKHNTDDMEITKTCAVMGCDDHKNLEPENFFRFPEDPSLRQIWVDLTGRHDWTPTDYSYICIQHFSADCFTCEPDGDLMLISKAVPSLKLPKHVLEVEYIDEDLENEGFENGEEEYEMGSEDSGEDREEQTITKSLQDTSNQMDNLEILKLFTDVQKMQRQAVGLKDKLRSNMKLHNQQAKYLQRLQESIQIKQKIMSQKKKRKSRILLTIQDKIKEDTNGLVLAMPTRHSDDLKNFALSIYKYSPQAYIYARNTLRTLLPSTDVLDSWMRAGYQPKNVMSNANVVKVVAEQSESELSCKVTLI